MNKFLDTEGLEYIRDWTKEQILLRETIAQQIEMSRIVTAPFRDIGQQIIQEMEDASKAHDAKATNLGPQDLQSLEELVSHQFEEKLAVARRRTALLRDLLAKLESR